MTRARTTAGTIRATITVGRSAWVATAPTGSAWSGDEGRSWKSLSGLSGLWAVDFANEQTGWLVGTKGQIVRIDF